MLYIFGDYMLDAAHYELRKAGVLVPLEPRVFDLLASLVQYPGRTVTKEELWAQVWPGQSVVSNNSLPKCVEQARKAIGDTGRTPRYIQTVRSRGYRFIGPVHERHREATETDSAARRVRPAVALRLPVTGAHLVGRAQEVAWLDRLWADGQANILSIVAWGGLGKSALLNHWIGALARDGWRGAARVFGWTFSSQGVRDTVASADGFIEAALGFFGDPEPHLSTPWAKGQRLAQLICAQRTLLLLDGLEPLQQPPGPEAGKVKDPALATLLQALAFHNAGLCVLTTRLAVADIAAFHAPTVAVLALDALPEDAGAALLQTLGVVIGPDAERRAASQEFGGHALALQLLGTYLRDACGGDVRRRGEIAVFDDWSEEGGHAWRVMASYERWFGQGPEVAVLRVLGLFDRMASADEMAAVRAEPPIPGLNDALRGLTVSQWMRALRRLRTAGLLAPPDPHTPHALDAHPLVREYYRHQLREHSPAAWRAGHERLFRHLQASVVEEYPATIEGLLPLYAAVTHGCLAGREQDALQVFRARIRRGDQQFSVAQLGAFGVDLAALAQFFVVPWSPVVPSFPADDALFVLQAAGECLSALGRVGEAAAPLQHALTFAHTHAHWTSAALAAAKLSEVYRAQGDLTTALRVADQSAAYGRRPGVPLSVQVLSYTFLGFAHDWVGHFAAAEAAFQIAERLQQQLDPARPLLHGILGYMYSELLLDQLESQVGSLTPAQGAVAWRRLHRRVAQTLAWAEHDGLPRDIGLQHVSMGRLYLLAWQHQIADADASSLTTPTEAEGVMHASPPAGACPLPPRAQAGQHLTWAVEQLRRSNHRNYMPRGLLTRAALYRLQNNLDLAHADVNEALALAESGAMDFYQVDAYLEQAALFLAASCVSPPADACRQAHSSLAQARTLIHTMGYSRRQRQVGELEAMLRRVAEG